ncbi:MAG: hypothetical protein ACE5HO_03845 [bacterium]
MDIVNRGIDFIFNLLFSPFAHVNPVWGMAVVSFVTGIVMLFVFKATSDQAGIKKAKNVVKAHFLAIRLYRDDISLMFETMKNIIVSNLLYMKKSLRPMLFLIIPVGLILIQLGSRYEYRPLRVGERTVLTLRLDRTATLEDLSAVEMELPAGLSVETPPVRIEQLQEIDWRIKAEQPGSYEVAFKLAGRSVKKRIDVVDRLISVAPQIARGKFSTTLMNPAEPSVPKSASVFSIGLVYPKREFKLLGMHMHWLVAFFVLSLVFGFAFKGVLGVEL